jgi:hypothetical protein
VTAAGADEPPGTGIGRAREELFAAHLLASTGFAAQAVVLALRGALAAAGAALLALGRVPPGEPAAAAAAFVRHVVRGRGLDPDAGRLLRSLLERALLADAGGAVPPEAGPAAVRDATSVVDAVDAWLAHSEYVAIVRDATAPRKPSRRG